MQEKKWIVTGWNILRSPFRIMSDQIKLTKLLIPALLLVIYYLAIIPD